MNRIDKNQWMMDLAMATSKRATCLRAQVGCVTFDAKGRVLSTGYNGVPLKFEHCSPACPGQSNKDGCLTVHGEINALIQCKNCDDIVTVACTLAPCFRCTKALLNTGMRTLLYNEAYDAFFIESRPLLLKAGIVIIQVK